jgi:hypothetical protein
MPSFFTRQEGNDVFLIAAGVNEECVDTVLSCFGESLDMSVQNNVRQTSYFQRNTSAIMLYF